MPKKEGRASKALDKASNIVTAVGAIADVGTTAGALAGGKLLWDAVTAGVERRRRKQAQDYLSRLAESLGDENTAALCIELDQAGENEVWEVIEEGFRTMMVAIDETAKRCVALLVADYVVRQELPDREFRLYGKLFADSDEAILQCLYALTSEYAEVYDQPGESLDPRGYSYNLLSGKRSDVREVFFHRNDGSDKAEARLESSGRRCPDCIQLVTRMLEQYELGKLQTSAAAPTIPRKPGMKRRDHYLSLFIVHQDLSARFRRLHNYLAPVFLEPSAAP